MLCCNAYDLSIKTSPVTPVSSKVEKLSDFPLILIIHRETRCLSETSTGLAGAKINAEIKNVMVLASDWMQKLRFSLAGC